jgi:hypothetical protein
MVLRNSIIWNGPYDSPSHFTRASIVENKASAETRA